MGWQVVEPGGGARVRWRNGGGVTRELAAWPSAEAWTWRVSVATVDRDGPFSAFDGVDRWFAVLSGAGVELRLDEADTHRITANDPPFCFDGGRLVDCRLLGAGTEDLNLMVRRAAARDDRPRRSSMARVEAGFGAAIDARTALAVFALDGGCTGRLQGAPVAVAAGSLAWTRVETSAELRIESGRALVMQIAEMAEMAD